MSNVVEIKPRLYEAKPFSAGHFVASGTLCGHIDFATPNGTYVLSPDEAQAVIVMLQNARVDVLAHSDPLNEPEDCIAMNGREYAEAMQAACETARKLCEESVAAERKRCAKVADQMRIRHGSPTGDAYACGTWDQGVRIAQQIRNLNSEAK